MRLSSPSASPLCSSFTIGAISWAHKLLPNPAYKISKAALHILNAQYKLDLGNKGFTLLLISPGVRLSICAPVLLTVAQWLETDLGGEHADLPVETGVSELKCIMLSAAKEHDGKFLNIHVPGQEQA